MGNNLKYKKQNTDKKKKKKNIIMADLFEVNILL